MTIQAMRQIASRVISVCSVANGALGFDLPVIEVDRDNFEIRQSARIVIAKDLIVDEDGEGVIHIVGEGLTIDFTGAHLRGAADGAAPDEYIGVGVRVTGANNTIRGGRFSGFKVAIHAHDADGLTIEDVNVSDNFRQRVSASEPRPFENDNHEWMTNYGAGVSIESSNNVTVRRVLARNVQNGILLANVNDSRVYDNDCSFLTGWGLALWRSSRNAITRNAFDFCVRGASDGGRSAGILLAEQCSENLIAQNSATHGGAGLLAFGGREAIGKVNPRDDLAWYERRGNNGNVVIDNDFSYAAGHGIEITFGFDNLLVRNRLVRNASCGVRAGFVQDTLVALSEFDENGGCGVCIEHGAENTIQENRFRRNPVGVRLSARDDHPLLETPWAQVNHRGSSDNLIVYNDFIGERQVVQIERSEGTRYGRNLYVGITEFMDMDEQSMMSLVRARREPRLDRTHWDDLTIHGESSPVGARRHLRGGKHIVMHEWGPYDWSTPGLYRYEREPGRHAHRVLGNVAIMNVELVSDHAEILREDDSRTLIVHTDEVNRVVPYSLVATTDAGEFVSEGALAPAGWAVTMFPWHTDPREDVTQWRREGRILEEGAGVHFEHPHLRFEFGRGGPSQLADAPQFVAGWELPTDRFGTIAHGRLVFPAGERRIRATAIDGVRVLIDDEVVIEDWKKGPRRDYVHAFTIEEEREVSIRVEHFALEGEAALVVEIE